MQDLHLPLCRVNYDPACARHRLRATKIKETVDASLIRLRLFQLLVYTILFAAGSVHHVLFYALAAQVFEFQIPRRTIFCITHLISDLPP